MSITLNTKAVWFAAPQSRMRWHALQTWLGAGLFKALGLWSEASREVFHLVDVPK